MPLVYNNYAAAIAWFSESNAFRMRGTQKQIDPYTGEAPIRFVKSALSYRDTLIRRQIDFVKIQSKLGGSLPEGYEEFDSRLYRPVYFATFGRPDSVGFCLVDEVESITTIGLKTNAICERTLIAFAPSAASIREQIYPLLNSPESDFEPCLVDPEFVFTRHGPSCPLSDQPETQIEPEEFTSHATTGLPLAGVVEFSLSGLLPYMGSQASLEAATCAMAQVILETLGELRENLPNIDPSVICADDLKIASNKFTILHGQGDSDIALLYFGTNYSVLSSIIVALRSLQYSKLSHFINYEERTQNFLGPASVMQRFSQSSSDASGLKSNHVFGATFSTLGVSPEIFRGSQQSKLPANGLVETRVDLTVSCGHVIQVKEAYENAILKSVGKFEPKQLGARQDYISFVVGHQDLSYRWPLDSINEANPRFLRTSDFLSASRECYESLGFSNFGDEAGAELAFGTADYETGLLNLVTGLATPVPTLLSAITEALPVHDRQQQTLHPSLIPFFYKLGHRLFFYESRKNSGNGKQQDGGQDLVLFDIMKLSRSMKRIQLPRGLRRAIISLYEECATLFSDFQVIRHVLDLYDCLATLYTMLTSDLITSVLMLEADERSVFADEAVVSELHEYVNALWQSLRSRFYPQQRSTPFGDFRFGWQANATKYLLAADAMLKCTLGVSRVIDRRIHRSRLAGFLEITEHPRSQMTCSLLSYQCESKSVQRPDEYVPPRLSCVRLDFSTLFSCLGYAKSMHEGLHVLSETFKYGVPDSDHTLRNRIANSSKWDSTEAWKRYEELFVSCLQYKLLFQGDTELFWRFAFMKASLVPKSNLHGTRRLFYVALEHYMVNFMGGVFGELTKGVASPDKWLESKAESKERFCQLTEVDLKSIHERCYKRFRKYFRRYYLLKEKVVAERKAEKLRSTFLTAVTEWHDKSKEEIWSELERANDIFISFVGKQAKTRTMILQSQLNEAFDDGSPSKAITSRQDTDHGHEKVDSPDELLLCCAAVHTYLSRILTDEHEKYRVNAFRDLEGDDYTGNLVFDRQRNGRPANLPWANYIIDPLASGIRVPISSVRRDLLISQFVTSRILWDASGILGSRRLRRIVESVFPLESS